MAEITVGQYVLDRVSQLGVKSVFGLPGDFNLQFLDLIESHTELEWIGCCNEQNAAYAADGYARASKGFGCVVTTFGVGELSLTNAIAGSYSERVPVIHLVGSPASKAQKSGALLHHTFGDGRFDIFKEIAAKVTVGQAVLSHARLDEMPSLIDDAILKSYELRRPCYIEIPGDVVFFKVPKPKEAWSMNFLKRQMLASGLPYSKQAQNNPQDASGAATSAIQKVLESAQKPLLIVDVDTKRFDWSEDVKTLVEKIQIPFVSTMMCKGAISEEGPLYMGSYSGRLSDSSVLELVDESDCLISIGRMPSNLNTGSFTHAKESIAIASHRTTISAETAETFDVPALILLQSLSRVLEVKPRPNWAKSAAAFGYAIEDPSLEQSDEPLRQDKMWPIIAKFLRPNDIVFAEVGTSVSGVGDVHLPGISFESSTLWSSIGWAGGAILGGCFAAREQGRRAVLITGEGSYQESIQDISTVIKHNLPVLIILVNNNGFTIERIIHGPQQAYNDVPTWRWQSTLEYFELYRVSKISLDEQGQTLIEVHADPLDAPPKLAGSIRIYKEQLAAAAAAQATMSD